MRNPRRSASSLIVSFASVAVLAVLAGCSAPDAADTNPVIRLALPSPGEGIIATIDSVALEFEEETGVAVEVNYLDNALYETIGLQNVLTSRDAPDIYWEWTGARIEARVEQGQAADLSEAIEGGALDGLISAENWNSVSVDGVPRLVPYQFRVANVLWFDEDRLSAVGLTAPQTWDELLDACQVLNAQGITPISIGNLDLWPAGNWLGHLASRIVGDDVYAAALSGESGFDDPSWVTAFEHMAELTENRCLNESFPAANATEGSQLFLQGASAMHFNGAWFLERARNEAPDLDVKFVNLPELPNERSSNSIISVMTGFAVNAQSENQDLAIDFLAFMNSDDNLAKFIDAGALPVAAYGNSDFEVDPRQEDLNRLVEQASSNILPPDTGFDLERADAFYRAVANVLSGELAPADAPASIAQN